MNGLVEEQAARREASLEEAAAVVAACPDPQNHYVTEVNRGSIRMQTWQGQLNRRFQAGYRLAHVLEQDGNTVQVFEHSHP